MKELIIFALLVMAIVLMWAFNAPQWLVVGFSVLAVVGYMARGAYMIWHKNK